MLAILTPSYNRAKLLPILFESLQGQSNKNFEWCIVDDGSKDETEQIVTDMVKQAEFPIRYIKKENGGKHTALNRAIKILDRELVFIVDSDDQVTPDAVDIILRNHEAFKDRKDLCGYAFLRSFKDGSVNGKPFPEENWITDYITARINSNDVLADKAEVFYAKCLREFPFPEFPGEKFLGEDAIWIRMACIYKMVHINQVIYVGEYLQDGMTRSGKGAKIASPKGEMYRAMALMNARCNFKSQIKGAVMFGTYGLIDGLSGLRIMQKSKFHPLVILGMPISFAFAKWFLKKWTRPTAASARIEQ